MVLTVEPGCYIRAGEGVPGASSPHRRAHRGRRAGDRRRARGADPRGPEDHRRHRSADGGARDAADYDVVIAGGGPVGGALALALRGSGLARRGARGAAARTTAGEDPRPIALSHGSRLILERLGAVAGACARNADRADPRLAARRVRPRRARRRRGRACRRSATWSTTRGSPPLVAQSLQGGCVRLPGRAPRPPASSREGDAAAVRTRDGAGRATRRRASAGRGGWRCADGRADAAHRRLPPDGGDGPRDEHRGARTTSPTSASRRRDRSRCCRPASDSRWSGPTTPERAERLCAAPERGVSAASCSRRSATGSGASGRRRGGRCFRWRCESRRDIAAAAHGAHRQRRPDAASGRRAGPEPRAARCLGARRELRRCTARAASARRSSSRAIAARRRLDRGGGIWFTDALVRVFSDDHAPLRCARGLGLAALGALPPARDFLVRRMIFGARG